MFAADPCSAYAQFTLRCFSFGWARPTQGLPQYLPLSNITCMYMFMCIVLIQVFHFPTSVYPGCTFTCRLRVNSLQLTSLYIKLVIYCIAGNVEG